MKIIRNMAKCAICGKILESKDRHDYQSCEHISVDGGMDYLKRSYVRSPYDIIEMNICLNEETGEYVHSKPHK